jgi:hypothetical protein
MLDLLFSAHLDEHPGKNRLRSAAERRLARAFLNRAHDALHAGRPELARLALRRSWEIGPSEAVAFLRDPRLGIQMATLALAPGLAGRLFGTTGCSARSSGATHD